MSWSQHDILQTWMASVCFASKSEISSRSAHQNHAPQSNDEPSETTHPRMKPKQVSMTLHRRRSPTGRTWVFLSRPHCDRPKCNKWCGNPDLPNFSEQLVFLLHPRHEARERCLDTMVDDNRCQKQVRGCKQGKGSSMSNVRWSGRPLPLFRDLRTAEMSAFPCLCRKLVRSKNNRFHAVNWQPSPTLVSAKHVWETLTHDLITEKSHCGIIDLGWHSSQPPYIGHRRHVCRWNCPALSKDFHDEMTLMLHTKPAHFPSLLWWTIEPPQCPQPLFASFPRSSLRLPRSQASLHWPRNRHWCVLWMSQLLADGHCHFWKDLSVCSWSLSQIIRLWRHLRINSVDKLGSNNTLGFRSIASSPPPPDGILHKQAQSLKMTWSIFWRQSSPHEKSRSMTVVCDTDLHDQECQGHRHTVEWSQRKSSIEINFDATCKQLRCFLSRNLFHNWQIKTTLIFVVQIETFPLWTNLENVRFCCTHYLLWRHHSRISSHLENPRHSSCVICNVIRGFTALPIDNWINWRLNRVVRRKSCISEESHLFCSLICLLTLTSSQSTSESDIVCESEIMSSTYLIFWISAQINEHVRNISRHEKSFGIVHLR